MIEMIAQMVGPMLKGMPQKDQADFVSAIEQPLRQWLVAKRTLVSLQPGEEQLVLMFTIDQRTGHMLMVPVVVNEDNSISRTLPEQGVDVTRMAQHVPIAPILMGILTGKEKLKPQDIINPLRDAAQKARLTAVAPPAPAQLPEPSTRIEHPAVSDLGELDGMDSDDDTDDDSEEETGQ